MVKGWSAPVIECVHGLITLAFSCRTPTWLRWGWLYPKPKDPDNGITLDGLRPLMLLEVLRKIWMWIHNRKIFCPWDTHNALNPNQHGFRRGYGTDSALIVHLNCMEHALLSHTPLFMSSWDIRRAFDSVSKEAMDASWRRLGVSPTTAHWIALLDNHSNTAIRSPCALEAWHRSGYDGFGTSITSTRPCTFTRKRGTPQGDVSSPNAWTAFFDIALGALAATDPSLYYRMLTSRSASALVSDIGYADDLVSMSSSLDGLQHKADIMTAFALLFDLDISVPKLRAVCLGPAPPHPNLTIRGPGWAPTTIPVRSHGFLFILGLTVDLSSPQVTQPRKILTHLIQATTILGHQRVVDTSALVASVSTMAKPPTRPNSPPGPPKTYRRWMSPSTGPFAVSSNSRPLTRTPYFTWAPPMAVSALRDSRIK